MNEQQKQLLNALSTWNGVSFPNGSNYSEQHLPIGKFDGVSISKERRGWSAIFEKGETHHVDSLRRGIGGGTELGKHFCTRDQGLVDLM